MLAGEVINVCVCTAEHTGGGNQLVVAREDSAQLSLLLCERRGEVHAMATEGG